MQQEFDLEFQHLDDYTETNRNLDISESENYTGKEPTDTVSGAQLAHQVNLLSRNKKVNSFHQ